LIRQISIENPLWGAPRIHGELLKLGFEVAQSSVARLCVPKTSSSDDFGFDRENSLFLNQNSLFLRNNSLFCCVGISLQASEFARVSAFKNYKAGGFDEIPCSFPC
jgi:hypothetical protein